MYTNSMKLPRNRVSMLPSVRFLQKNDKDYHPGAWFTGSKWFKSTRLICALGFNNLVGLVQTQQWTGFLSGSHGAICRFDGWAFIVAQLRYASCCIIEASEPRGEVKSGAFLLPGWDFSARCFIFLSNVRDVVQVVCRVTFPTHGNTSRQ